MLRDLHTSRGPAAAFLAVGFYWGTFAALVPALKPQAGLSDGGFGLAMLVASCGAILSMALAPLAEARLGRRALPVLACVLGAVCLLPGLAWNGVSFALAMLCGAMASGTLDVVMNARVSVLEGTVRRPLMNLCHGIFSLGYAFAALLAGLGREFGLSPVAIFAGTGLAIAALILQIAAAPVEDPVRDPAEPPTEAPGWALLAPLGLVILVAFLAEQGTEGWSALHLERNLGAGAATGALGPAILGLTMAVGRLSGQAVAHRYSEASVIRAGACLTAVGALTAAWAPALALAYAGFAMLGLGVSVIAPMAFAWTGRLVATERKAAAISRVAVLGYAGFFVGPPMMGGLSEAFGLPASFSAVALLMLAIPLLLVPLVLRRVRSAGAAA